MEPMFFESHSQYDFEQTVEQLLAGIAAKGWKVIAIHDLRETMRKNGKTILPAKVIELCMPDYAYRILSDDELRIYSNMMPCRISVYQKADGQTFVSRLNTAMVSTDIGGVVSEVMSASFADVESFIEKIKDYK